jgi:Fibronectin type III domain
MSDWIDRAQRLLSSGPTLLRRAQAGRRSCLTRRVFVFEPLEPRLALSVAPGLVEVGTQPAGDLSGKIVYTSGGHGWQWNSSLGRWATDRGDNNEIVEDFGNQEQMTYYVDYLFRAGATVVPMRPVGRQINEVVVDNDLSSVTYAGPWSDSSGSRWYDEDYGAVADAVHYRFASTSATETAIATYTPNIPQAGFYPVYTWVSAGTNRTSQLYKINHTGGQTEVRVDHSMVGNGWVYLGTYHFDAGSSTTDGSVVISNEGAAGKVVIADAIRFGNGMGDVPWGSGGIGTGSVSGYPREDENSLMWLWRGVGQGVTPSSIIGTGNVSAPSMMAEEMNQNSNPFGTSVYISFHSNAGGGRGAVGLISDSGASYVPTPNQADLALFTGRQINQDMQALNGSFEYNWSTRTTHTYTSAFGEINNDDLINSNGVVEMDATIIEVAFHDSVEDAALMRDPTVRDQLARSTYQATLEYFDVYGGLNSPASLPTAPTDFRAASNASGDVTLSWLAGPSTPSSVNGAAATGFRVYASIDGYGFDGGTYVAGGGTTSATLTGYDPTTPYYFRVVAVNAGGESLPSEVVTALPSGGAKQVLIVNGFDRFDRTQDFRYPYAYTGDGLVDRVWSRYNNSFDYVVQVQGAIQGSKPGVHVDSTSNEAVISGAVNLGDYDTVIWISGTESTADHTFDAAEQTKVTNFINSGGNLFVSGSEIGWDLDQQNNGRTFFENTLKGNYVSDDANTYTATADAAGIFTGMSSFVFSNGSAFSNLDSQVYNVATPDVIIPQAGAVSALTYSGGTGGTAAIQVQGAGGAGKIVMFGFPFEAMTDASRRQTAMGRILDFFGVAVENADFNSDGFVDAGDYVPWRTNNGLANGASRAQGDANGDGAVNAADFDIWRAQFGTSPGSGSGGAIGSGGEDLAATALIAAPPVATPLAKTAGSGVSPSTAYDAALAAFATERNVQRAKAGLKGELVRNHGRATVDAHQWEPLLTVLANGQVDPGAETSRPALAAGPRSPADDSEHFAMPDRMVLHLLSASVLKLDM